MEISTLTILGVGCVIMLILYVGLHTDIVEDSSQGNKNRSKN